MPSTISHFLYIYMNTFMSSLFTRGNMLSPSLSPAPPPTPPSLGDHNLYLFLRDLPWILAIVLIVLMTVMVLNCRLHQPDAQLPLEQTRAPGSPPRRRRRYGRDKKNGAASITFTYKSSAAEPCAICLEDLKSGDECWRLVKCGHEYHKACIDPWLTRDKHCPLCRGSMRGASVRESSSLDQVL